MMGGRMWAESTGIPGEGATFHFTIQVDTAVLPERPFLQDDQPDLAGKRLLIVDDNETNRRILTTQAQSWHMEPLATGSPREALHWIQQGDHFDAAVLDMQMPEMDGLTLAGEIQKVRDAQSLPLIMLTSLGGREALRNSERELVDFAAFLSKPIKPSQLFNMLASIFSDKRPQRIAAPESPAPSQFDANMGRQHPLHILLAEDHPTNQKLALRLLDRLGYRADVAANGLEVLAALERQHYDVVLMDMQMPEMDGLEATRRLRADPVLRDIPIIALTALAMPGDKERCLEAGMDDYLSKPVGLKELLRVVSGWLTRTRAA
jgi:CheY-like chemotaxis protein